MSFSDRRTPPPAWAVSPDEAAAPASSAPAAQLSTDTGGTVISLRTRRRVTSPQAPPPADPEADPRTRGAEPDPHDWAREIVLRLLTGSPKSRSQLLQALRKRDCPEGIAVAVLDRLEDVGLVDDTAFAANLVAREQARKGLAGRALAQQLKSKGIDDETTRAVLEDVDRDAEEEMARDLVDKRMSRLHGLDPQVQARRLAGFLARKGYSGEVGSRVIREAIANAQEHQRD